MKVWVLMQEAESGAERDDVIAVYATKESAEASAADARAEHEWDDYDDDDPTDWCSCCDPAASFRVAEWEVQE
jgi:hypothetical protein